MDKKKPEDYQAEDFLTDESFINYHFHLNKADQVFWEDWLKAHPGSSKVFEGAKEMLQTLSLRLPDKEFREELAKLKNAIDNNEPVFIRKKPGLSRFLEWDKRGRSIKDRRRRAVTFLIPLLLLFFVSGYFFYRNFTRTPFQLSEKYNRSNAPVVFMLSDSTVVTLAPKSALRYPGRFGENERKVYLDGEAQFHVKTDPGHPFKVYSAEVVATVLGTIFNIKQQQGDSVVKVELLKGSLKVEAIGLAGATTQSIILYPEERVVFNRHKQQLYKESWQSNDARFIASRSHLKFHRDDFEAIAKKLKNVFGVNIVNQSNHHDWLFTGEFDNSTAKDIVESICIVKKLNYQVLEDTIFIK